MSFAEPVHTDPSRLVLRSDRILEVLRAATLGEYDVASELGRGGMAVVYLAHDLHLNRKVAIKALLPELLFAEDMDRRFKQEARVAAKLDHPNIVVIYNVRESKDLLYIVMKLVDGLPLSAVVRRSGALPIPVVKFVVRHIADALHYAHGEGVVHRDMKPANVMIDRKGNPVVMDFGIAKAVDEANLTHTGLVIGTPAYMSPEQCLSQRVTFAADQYSLGTVAYELLTGATPFSGSALEMQWAHAKEVPTSVRSRRPDCPPELDAMVLRMLSKKPDERWGTLQPIIDALAQDTQAENYARQFLQSLVVGKPGDPLRPLPTTPVSPVPRSSSGSGERAVAMPPRPAAAPPTPPPPTITITPARVELEEGESVHLRAFLDSGDEPEVAWATNNAAVAHVTESGTVTAVSAGIAEISAAAGMSRAACDLRVLAARVASVGVEPNELTLKVGETSTLAVAATSRSGRTIPPKDARFKSLDRSVARVTDRGVVTGQGVGHTELVVTVSGVEARARVVVDPVPVAGLRVDPPTVSLALGKKAKLKATPQDANGAALDGRTVGWATRDRSVVTVDSGRVVAVGAGSTTIDVTCDAMSIEVPVTVVAPIAPVAKAPDKEVPSRPVGRLVVAAIGLVAVVGGALIVRQWSSRAPEREVAQTQDTAATGETSQRAKTDSVARSTPTAAIDTTQRTSVVTPPLKGDSTPVGGTTEVPKRVVAASIERLPAALPNLEPGDSARLVSRVIGTDGQPMADAKVAWQSGNPAVATVSAAGWVRAVAPGNTTVVGVVGSVRRSVPLVVTPPLPQRVTLARVSDRLRVGESVQLHATVADKRQTPIAGARIGWRSLQPDVATVDDRGTVAGRTAGRVGIVATAGEGADTVSIDVEARPVPPAQPAENREPTVVRPPVVTPRDSSETSKRVPTPAVVEPLFRELANAVTTRANARITSIYPEGGSAADARLRRDFLKFVRDAEPKCAVRTVTVGATGPGGSAVTGTIGCTWRNNAGIPYDKAGAFSGTVVSSSTGWTLKDVRLAAKFW